MFSEQYSSAEERQAAMEEILIELARFESPDGKDVAIPYLMEIRDIYHQAEQELESYKSSR